MNGSQSQRWRPPGPARLASSVPHTPCLSPTSLPQALRYEEPMTSWMSLLLRTLPLPLLVIRKDVQNFRREMAHQAQPCAALPLSTGRCAPSSCKPTWAAQCSSTPAPDPASKTSTLDLFLSGSLSSPPYCHI
ncbi:hypothetical protein P7K49_006047 [Saguinus oedipus]|uniref:Uncharacterized protein n=1 Tax=Saguinus oedipus TaxID=9490 RepID=A0ABQ9W1B4_SAGOE|nr:hypothetical protein P7K49_006047 [Saguinus oedipus]